MSKRIKLKETDIKYLAGLLDADGCVFIFHTQVKGKQYVYPEVSISGNEEHVGDYFRWLGECLNLRPVRDQKQLRLTIRGRKLRPLADRLVKYMVVKGALLRWVCDVTENSIITDEELEGILMELKDRRRQGGAVKPRNFVGLSWIAGFLDGDGNYALQQRGGGRSTLVFVRAGVTKEEKVPALWYLKKTLGGSIRETAKGTVTWYLGLGKGHRSRAMKFLKEMRKRSRIKKGKIDKMIRWHEQQQPQRPTEKSG